MYIIKHREKEFLSPREPPIQTKLYREVAMIGYCSNGTTAPNQLCDIMCGYSPYVARPHIYVFSLLMDIPGTHHQYHNHPGMQPEETTRGVRHYYQPFPAAGKYRFDFWWSSRSNSMMCCGAQSRLHSSPTLFARSSKMLPYMFR